MTDGFLSTNDGSEGNDNKQGQKTTNSLALRTHYTANEEHIQRVVITEGRRAWQQTESRGIMLRGGDEALQLNFNEVKSRLRPASEATQHWGEGCGCVDGPCR